MTHYTTQEEADAAEQAAFARGDAEATRQSIDALTAAIDREHAVIDRAFAAGFVAGRAWCADNLEHAAAQWRAEPMFDLADLPHPVASILESHARACRPVATTNPKEDA